MFQQKEESHLCTAERRCGFRHGFRYRFLEKTSNKDKLNLCIILDIKEKIVEIPAKGYSAIPLLDVDNRACARSKSIIMRMIKEHVDMPI